MAAAVLASSALVLGAARLDSSAEASSGPGRPFAPVLEGVVLGDLIVAGNSNVAAAGGRGARPVDVDEEQIPGCVLAQPEAVCSDNSSSATLDVPAGAHVVAARLYVETTLPAESNPLQVRFDGPAEGFDYLELTDETPEAPKLYEARGDEQHASLLQAVWDVTALVREGGAGAYTVADIPNARTGMWEPYASWAIVAVYELDVTADLGPMGQVERARFAPRSISWADGFALADAAPVAIELGGLVVPDVTPFAKAFHLVASTRAGAVDNLLYDSQPLGNNHLAGPPPAVPGVVVGNDPACNTVTDVFNDTICHLGTPVAGKNPAVVVSGSDGAGRSSGAAVDMDVVRVPAHYVRPGQDAARLTARTLGDQAAAVGVMAVSIDLPHGLPAVAAVAAGERPTPAQLEALAEAATTTTTVPSPPAAAPPPTPTAATTAAPATSAAAGPTTTPAAQTQPDGGHGFVPLPAVPPPDTPSTDGSVTGEDPATTTTTEPEAAATPATEPASEPASTAPAPTDPPATAPPPTEPPVTEPPATAPPPTAAPPSSVPEPASTTTTTAVVAPTTTTTTVGPTAGATTTTPTTAGPTTTIAPSTTVLSSTIPDPDGDPITDVTEPPVETPSGRVVVPAGAIDPGVQRAITFPVAGPVVYGNDWGACRDGCARAHKGIDIIGDRLQPILAMTDGVVDHLIDHRTAGYGVALRDAEGWQYHVYHVNNDRPGTDDGGDDGTWRFAPGITEGAPVRAGQVIAWMGDSGNSEYSVPHAHVEIHRPDGTAVNPYWSLRLAQRRETCAAILAAEAQAAADDPAAASTSTTTTVAPAAPADGGQAAAAATTSTTAVSTTTTAAPTTTTTTVPDEVARAEQAEAEAWLEGGWKQSANVPAGWLPVELTGGRPHTSNLAARMWISAEDGQYIPIDAGALIVGDPRYEQDVDCQQPEEGIAPAIPAELGAILATIRQLESGGDYAAQARTSSASGAYQFVDGTWNNFGGYARAADAPPAVQDAAAVQLATRILNANGGNVAAIPLVWYIGHVPVGDEMDTVPAAPGNVLTPREYQTRWLRIYAEKSGSIEAAELSDAFFTLNAPILACRTTILELPQDRVATLLAADGHDGPTGPSTTTTTAAPATTATTVAPAPAGGAGANAAADGATTTTTTTVPAVPELGTAAADGLLTQTSGYQADPYGRAVLPETDVCDPARQPPDAPPPLPLRPSTGPF